MEKKKRGNEDSLTGVKFQDIELKLSKSVSICDNGLHPVVKFKDWETWLSFLKDIADLIKKYHDKIEVVGDESEE